MLMPQNSCKSCTPLKMISLVMSVIALFMKSSITSSIDKKKFTFVNLVLDFLPLGSYQEVSLVDDKLLLFRSCTCSIFNDPRKNRLVF